MARLTVEDCLDKVENRFELVLLAAKRARQLELGTDQAKVPLDNDKPTVLALREIADNHVDRAFVDRVSKTTEEGERKAAPARPTQFPIL